MPTIQPWIDGRPAPGRRKTDPVMNPWNGRELARVAVATDMPTSTDAIAGAQKAFVVMRTCRPIVAARFWLSTAASSAGTGPRSAGCWRRTRASRSRWHWARSIARSRPSRSPPRRCAGSAARRCRPISTTRGEGFTAITRQVPIGPISAISPFNFPLNLVAHKVAPAIAVGSSVVLKAPPQAPLLPFRLAALLAEAGLPPGALQVLHMPIPVAERLATDPAFALLSFTGSAQVGWHLKSVAGPKARGARAGWQRRGAGARGCRRPRGARRAHRVGRVSPTRDRSVSRCSGSWSIEPIAAKFAQARDSRHPAARGGRPLDPATVVGPMIDDGAADRVDRGSRKRGRRGATAPSGVTKGAPARSCGARPGEAGR